MLKKIILVCLNLTVLLTLTMMSCSSDDNDESTVMIPVASPNDDVKEFFESSMPLASEADFFSERDGDVCELVNSTEELNDLYSGTMPLPNIDFQKYTLVIGKKLMENSFYKLSRQQMVQEDDHYVLYLYVSPVSETASWPAFSYLNFWGLYPKTSKRDIFVKIER